MKQNSSNQKTSQHNRSDSNQLSAAGPAGLANTSPSHEIGSIAPLQLKAEPSAGGDGQVSPSPNHTGLPDTLKSEIESLAGLAMDDVRVHYNSSKPEQLEALAYTQGSDIHVAPGQERHLPHEAWHVVQQKQGRVAPTRNIGGKAINDSPTLEHEADSMGAKTASAQRLSSGILQRKSTYPSVVQRMAIYPADVEGQQNLMGGDQGIDRIICADLSLQHKKAGGHAYEWKDLTGATDSSLQLNDGEGLILVGHGSPGSIEGKTGAVLAKQLQDKVSNISSVKYIYISACMSAAIKTSTNKTLAKDLANSLGVNDNLVAGTEGYKINNLDLSIPSAVYHVSNQYGQLAGAISHELEEAYNLKIHEHPPEATNIETAEAVGDDLLNAKTSKFPAFMQSFGKALSGNAGEIDNLISVVKQAKPANLRTLVSLLEKAKIEQNIKPIAETNLTTGSGGSTTYEELTKSDENMVEEISIAKQESIPELSPIKNSVQVPVKNSAPIASKQSSSRRSSRRWCFITTACVEARGLPDDCMELTTLRMFRDEYIAKLDKGQQIIQVYYENAPAIVDAMNRQKNASEIYDGLYDIICKCVEQVQKKDYASAFQIYVDMMIKLRNQFTPMAVIPAFFYRSFTTSVR